MSELEGEGRKKKKKSKKKRIRDPKTGKIIRVSKYFSQKYQTGVPASVLHQVIEVHPPKRRARPKAQKRYIPGVTLPAQAIDLKVQDLMKLVDLFKPKPEEKKEEKKRPESSASFHSARSHDTDDDLKGIHDDLDRLRRVYSEEPLSGVSTPVDDVGALGQMMANLDRARSAARIREQQREQEELERDRHAIGQFYSAHHDLRREVEAEHKDEKEHKHSVQGSGPGTTSNIDLMNVGRKLFKDEFLGVVPRDHIQKLNPHMMKKSAFIFNTDPEGKPGTHWVSVFIDPLESQSLEVFDSFGREIAPDIRSQLEHLAKIASPTHQLKFKHNKIVEQRANSTNCGWLALEFLKDRFDGKTFAQATPFNGIMNSERRVEAFKHMMMPFTHI